MLQARQNKKSSLHYGWIIVASGVLVMFSCLGLARFSFGILLPSMSQALELNYAQRGYIGTGYFLGYLLMVGLAPRLIKRMGFRKAIAAGLALIAVSMGLLGLAGSYAGALIAYTFTGVGSGAANISMMALITNWFAPSLRGMATGTVIAGNGVGIIVSGFLAPIISQIGGAAGWRLSWVTLGLISLAVCLTAWLFLRDRPEEKGLEIAGSHGRRVPPPADAKGLSSGERRLLLLLSVIYFIFGLTYIIYGTFIVTTMVDEHGFSENLAGRFWAWVGFFSLFSGPIFGRISDRINRKTGLALVFTVQTTAYLLAGTHPGTTALYLSIALYGLAAWAIPTIMAATIGDRLGPGRTALGFSIITFFFAVGQVLGPTVAGHLADLTGSFSISYLLSACLTVAAILLSLKLRPIRRSPQPEPSH